MLRKKKESERLSFEWGTIEWVASQSLANSAAMTVGLVTIHAGQNNPLHRHPNCEEILHLIHGRLEHTLDSQTFAMDAGDTITIAPGHWHNARAVGTEDAVMVVCFSSPDRQTELFEDSIKDA